MSVAYDGVPAVQGVDLTLDDGQVLAVLGPSGCGKSTLLRAVAGLEPASGAIAWDGRDLAGVPTHRRGFALMFQDGQLFGHLTVAGNVGYALRLRRRPRAEVRARVAELLELTGLSGYADRLPGTLSGGERQRVALARSLAVEPRLLLLDEPLSALDVGLRERLATDLRAILRAAGTTALWVTHDHEEAFVVADRLAVMRAGRVLQSGAIDEVWRAPVDADTALLLGYARTLDGAAAAMIGGAAGIEPGPEGLALRRSALRLDDDGPLTGVLESFRPTPDQVRLRVRLDGPDVGGSAPLYDAVAPLDRPLVVGERVRVVVDPTRVAPLGSRSLRGSL
ncbi:ABC transporter ATP-binding protein [Nocardioides fonticola]|uniref:ABC transporter ATP-binding protein n=1 Tax=Nocardioides fonticola TaxID=450363 RepID=UPI0031D985C2